MQRKWRREWERCKKGYLVAQSTNVGSGSLKTLAKTIFPPMMAAAMLLGAMTTPAYANPAGGQVTSGTGSISQNGNTMNINQTTNKLSINWQSFNIGTNETVNFIQPGTSSIALNRVVGNNASSIYGHLNANGQVFLVNTNGVLFAPGSSVNVGGLVASTLNLSDSDFQKGDYQFSGSGGLVVNQGTITAGNGGYVALQGGQVSNQGIIIANQGTVALGAGKATTLDFNGDGLYSLAVTQAALNAAADNRNLIQANGGQVVMTARAANALAGSVLNNSGVIEAQSIGSANGIITLDGGTVGSVVNSGTLDASGKSTGQTGGTVKVLGNTVALASGTRLDASGDSGGGFIETSGDKVRIDDNAIITTAAPNGKSGNWLIDPDGFTIGIGGDMTGTALTNALTKGSVTIASINGSGSGGNINVNDTVAWSANTLALNATKNIYVNNAMTATGSAGLTATYGAGVNADGTPMGLYTYQGGTNNVFSGKINFSGTGKVTLNGTPYTVIQGLKSSTANGVTTYGLDYVKDNPSGNYVLGSDISSLIISSEADAIGSSTAFTGSFNGFGHLITSPTMTATGLFGTIGSDALVSNLGITSATVNTGTTGKPALGILANVNQGNLVNSFAGGTLNVRGTTADQANVSVGKAGGLVGVNSGLIAQSYTLAYITGATDIAGGLVGTNEARGRILDSSARATAGSIAQRITSATTGTASISYVGGLVGVNAGTIDRSYAANLIKLTDANSIAGGFVGANIGTIDQCYSYNESTSSNAYTTGPNIGGFVGNNSGMITNAYTTSLNSTSSSAQWNAGFAYQNSGIISNAYATAYSGNTLNSTRYGFVGNNTGTITNAYWYGNSSTNATVAADSSAAKNLKAAQAATFASYTNFDPGIWGASMSGYPILNKLPVYVSTISSSIPVYGSATSAISTLSLSVQGLQGGGGTSGLRDNLTGNNPFTVVTDNGYVDAGNQAAADVLSSSIYSNIKGTVTIKPKELTISGVVADKVYDGTTGATVNNGVMNGGLVGLVDNQTLNINYTSAAFTDKNAGVNKDATVTYTLTDGTNNGKASNYTISSNHTMANIGKKSINAIVTGTEKDYDGTTSDSVTWKLPGMVSGDDLSLSYTSALFDDKNVGQSKTVTVSGLTLTGADNGNYMLQNSLLQTTANITPLKLILYGTKPTDSKDSVSGSNLSGMNVVVGDSVVLGGSVKLASTTAGVQAIVDTTGLTVSNPNYTVVGSIGSVVVGTQSLALDKVASGTATIATTGNTTTITQTTDKAVIDWLRFSVGNNETVNFVQPTATSIVLNRVTGNEASTLAGNLTANGRVFIINANGVLFSAGSRVNVGALVASTLNVSDTDFAKNNYLFTSTGGNGSVIAAGDIVIVDGGFLALVSGNGVTNSGTVTAHSGKALLTSANNLNLTMSTANSGLSSYNIANLAGKTTTNSSIDISGTHGNKDGLLETAGSSINASGLTLNSGNNGTWSWTQEAITVGNGESMDSNFIATNLGSHNFNLNALNGDITLNGSVGWNSDKTLTLNAGNDININAPIAATGSNAGLVMNYGGDYNIRTKASYSGSVLDAKGNSKEQTDTSGGIYGSVTLNGSNASLKINGNSYTLIHSMSQLDALDGYNSVTGIGTAGPVSGSYALAGDLDASDTTYKSAPISTLSGTFAGLGHTISNLTINSSDPNVGLIGTLGSSSAYGQSAARDIGIVNAKITSTYSPSSGFIGVGVLAGVSYGNIKQAYSTGTIASASVTAGGLIGMELGSSPRVTVSDCYSDVTVNGTGGGLLGRAQYTDIYRSHATGNVTTTGSNSGGLVGYGGVLNVYNSYATGRVKAGVDNLATGEYVNQQNVANGIYAGGLIGQIASGPGTIQNSFATGAVSGGSNLGGLVGYLSGDWGVVNCYATGNVTSYQNKDMSSYLGIGGLIGYAYSNGSDKLTITNSHATGDVGYVNGGSWTLTNAGGLLGYANAYVIDHSYATGNVKGLNSGTGGLVGGGGNTSSSISNSYATGNVSAGSGSVGGLAGNSQGKITNSWASGNVTGNGSSLTSMVNVGGLVGSNNGSGSIINSYATGSVNGLTSQAFTGGLAGSNTGSIVNSYATGKVTSQSPYTGGVAGANFGSGTITKSYYNSDVNSGLGLTSEYTPSGQMAGTVDGSKGLTGKEFSNGDINYYLNGTIDQVHAARADAQQTAVEQAGTQAGIRNQASQTTGDALQKLVDLLNPANLWQSSVDEHDASANSGSYSAHIKSVEANGVEYQLEDNDSMDKEKITGVQ